MEQPEAPYAHQHKISGQVAYMEGKERLKDDRSKDMDVRNHDLANMDEDML
jgi:hypothetical protein